MGIDTEKFHNRNKRNFLKSNSEINILTIGRLVEKKGIIYSIKAVSGLIKEGFHICYHIVGDGYLKNKFKKLVKKLNLNEKIKIYQVKSNLIKSLYSWADIFVLSSVKAKNGDQEGTPIVLLEAQSMSLPVISTIHSGIPEIVLDNQTGFLVPEHDIKEIKEKLKTLILNSKIRLEMGINGREHILRNFSIEKMSKKILNIYKSIL
jgi:colanic acid/amylovoran biosynthesis glycosyltransferase